MKYVLLLITSLFAAPCLAQSDVYNVANKHRDVLQVAPNDEPAEGPSLEVELEDVDDLNARYAISDDIEFFAGVANVFELEMFVDRFDKEQLIDHEPKALDETYPVGVSSRSIAAGVRITF